MYSTHSFNPCNKYPGNLLHSEAISLGKSTSPNCLFFFSYPKMKFAIEKFLFEADYLLIIQGNISHLSFYFYFFFFNHYLKIRVTERRERQAEQEIFNSCIHLVDGRKGQRWVRWKAGVVRSVWVCPMGVHGDKTRVPFSASLPGH